MKKIVHKKRRSFSIFLLQVIATALAVFGLVLYTATGKNAFSSELSIPLMDSIKVFIAAQGVVILLFIIFKGERIKPIVHLCQFVVAIVGMLSFALFITNNINYLASIIAAIDGTPITVEFVGTSALLLGAFFFSLVVANVAVSVKLGGKGYEQ